MMNKSILCLSIIMLLMNACRHEAEMAPKNEVIRVRVMSISPEDVNNSIHSSGILSSEEEIRLSFKTGGIVAVIKAREGQSVKKGDLLASLNLSEINANVGMAGNAWEKALRDWTRVKNLYADTVATLEQFQNATTALNVAESNLEIAKFNLLHSAIKAPADGSVLKQLVRENELVGPGYPVFLFGSKGKFWKVRSGLSDRDIVKVNPGDSAEVFFDAWPGVKFTAVVDLVSEMANPMTGTYETEMSLDGLGYRLASGFVASVDIYPLKRETYILIPVGAIIGADGMKGFVWTVSDSSTAQRHEIRIEAIKGSEAVITGIPEGINAIVSEGAAYMKEGIKVEIVR